MSENSTSKIVVVGVVALIIGAVITWAFLRVPDLTGKQAPTAGAPGNLLAEDYDPYIQYNGGFNTAKGITNSGTLTQSGASTFSGTVSISGALTQGTASNSSTLHSSGTCNLYSGRGITTILASTTRFLDCQAGESTATALSDIPAWALGDVVLVGMPTTTPTTLLGLRVTSAQSSTTAGYIQIGLMNQTGADYTLAPAATGTWFYFFER